MKAIRAKEIWNRIKRDILQYKWFAAVFLIYDVAVHALTGAFCPMLLLTGLPCPGCGMTRAALFFAAGQFERAMQANPAVILWALFLLYFVIQRYIRGVRVKGAPTMAGGIALFMIVVYCYRMATQFPGYPPMSIRYDNVTSFFWPEYSELLRRL